MTSYKRKKNLAKSKLISVIVPVFNDSSIIHTILKETVRVVDGYRNYEILVINNGSNDGTAHILRLLQKRNTHIRSITLSRNYEFETALTAGLDNSIGDYIVMMNPKTDPPEVISKILLKLSEGNDIVLSQYKSGGSLYTTVPATYVMSICQKVLKYNFSSHFNYLIGLNRRAVNALLKIKRKNKYLTLIKNLIGFRKISISYAPTRRYASKIKKMNVVDICINILDISISNSFRPLRIATFLGMLASFFSVIYILYIFLIAIFKKNVVEGWISTSLITGGMFFLLFTILTVISEYLVRITYELRDDPLYFISEESDNSVFSKSKKTLNIV